MLTKRMYGTEMSPVRGPFGLYSGQMRGGITKIQHNAGWFNRAGELLGWGDLCAVDFLAIASTLPHGTPFVVLSEDAWRFNHADVKRAGITNYDYERPGTDWVVRHADKIVRNERCYVVERSWTRSDSRWETYGELPFRVISREAARQIILFG
jgi:hypothetical protein